MFSPVRTSSPLVAAILTFSVLPSAWLAWRYRDMPHFGRFGDDGIYFVGAKSLAEGQGYRILSLPGQPHQTKYPPLFPALLSTAWRWRPDFPGNLPATMLLCWLTLPAFTLLTWRVVRGLGLGQSSALLASALVAINPYVVFLAVSPMSDLLFTCWLLLAFLAASRGTPASAAAAGALAGAGYLTRTAAAPLLLTLPFGFLLRRQHRHALLSMAAMLPAVLCWNFWVKARLAPCGDETSCYYTDYIGSYFYNVSLNNLSSVAWGNFRNMLSTLGGLIAFHAEPSFLTTNHARLTVLVAIAGVIRLVRRHGISQYHLFAATYLAILVTWHYKPTERVMIPLFPLLLAGFITEVGHIATSVNQAIRQPETAQRIAAIFLGGTLAVLLFLALAASASGLLRILPGEIERNRASAPQNLNAYQWIRRNAPKGARFIAYNDVSLFLHTGHPAFKIAIPPKLYYTRDREGIAEWLRRLEPLNQVDYYFQTPEDFALDLQPDERARVAKALQEKLTAIYQNSSVVVYSVKKGPPGATVSAPKHPGTTRKSTASDTGWPESRPAWQ